MIDARVKVIDTTGTLCVEQTIKDVGSYSQAGLRRLRTGTIRAAGAVVKAWLLMRKCLWGKELGRCPPELGERLYIIRCVCTFFSEQHSQSERSYP